MKHKLLRTLIALCLILVLLVNLSPIRAEAVSAGVVAGSLIGVGAGMVVASALIGLGVLPSFDTSVFDGFVNDVVDNMTSAGIVANGVIDVLRVSSGIPDKEAAYAIPQHLLSWIQDYAYESGAVNYSEVTVPVLTADSWFAGGLGNLDFKASVDVNVLARYYGVSSSYFYIYAFEPFSYHVTSSHYESTGIINSYDSKPFTYSGTTFYYGSISRQDLGSYEGPMLGF